jgi:hypothetical protein
MTRSGPVKLTHPGERSTSQASRTLGCTCPCCQFTQKARRLHAPTSCADSNAQQLSNAARKSVRSPGRNAVVVTLPAAVDLTESAGVQGPPEPLVP